MKPQDFLPSFSNIKTEQNKRNKDESVMFVVSVHAGMFFFSSAYRIIDSYYYHQHRNSCFVLHSRPEATVGGSSPILVVLVTQAGSKSDISPMIHAAPSPSPSRTDYSILSYLLLFFFTKGIGQG